MSVQALSFSARRILSLLLSATALCACAPPRVERQAITAEAQISEVNDSAWQHAAEAALGGLEGTVIVMDAQTGRLRAVVNPRLAFEQAYPPGSAIKPFTALAALRSGIAARDSRTECRGRYERNGDEAVCSHPSFNHPLNLPQAIAYSCNYYFSHLGARLGASAFNATLAAFGFGVRTGVGAGGESAGALTPHEMRLGDAIGEGDHLLVTPIQLITAYAALVNGGHLYRPRFASAENFAAQEVRQINIAFAHRAVLIEGMRNAVRAGTASRAGFDRVPLDVIGKTGTSTSSNGFRTQGWFVGFVAERGRRADLPDAIRTAVLVFVKRAHGAECAEVARRVITCGMRNAECGIKTGGAATRSHGSTSSQISNLKFEIHAAPTVRVKFTRSGEVRALALEEYVRGVLAGEASVEDQFEALKAQAVVSRTFALKNLGRHAKEGYDFCDLTHCQSFQSRAAVNRDAAYRAAVATAGQVLSDGRGRTADVYFHASCGGRTTGIDDVWGVAAPEYLRGVNDEVCAALSHRQWWRAIAAHQLVAALRRDERSDSGGQLENIIVTKRDASGRAAVVTLEGTRRRTLRGWDFALIVNRALGWSTIRSAKFDVLREGSDFVFRGSGLGHGLGLCQEGAHLRARRGASWRQILAHYFPGTRPAEFSATRAEPRSQISSLKFADLRFANGGRAAILPPLFTPHSARSLSRGAHHATFNSPLLLLPLIVCPTHSAFVNPQSAIRHPRSSRAVLSSEHFRVNYPAGLSRGEVEDVLRTLEAAHADLARRLSAASLAPSEAAPINVVIHATTGDFVGVTGQPPWAAAATSGRRIELQPLTVLRRRGVLTNTLRHEYAHTVIEALGRGRTPRRVAEGLAILFAGEGEQLVRTESESRLSRDELERRLVRPASAREMRRLYAAAYREVLALVREGGEARAWREAARGN